MVGFFSSVFGFLWELFKIWSQLFAAPFLNLEMLWIIVPVYLNWFFADFFQEKRGTSLGNAVSNGVVIIWASTDWVRTSVKLFFTKAIATTHLVGNIGASLLVFSYGVWIVYDSIKGKAIAHYIGRIRVVTYILLMITPLVYNSDISVLNAIVAMVLFFPVFYFLGEGLDRILPDPVTIRDGGKGTATQPTAQEGIEKFMR